MPPRHPSTQGVRGGAALARREVGRCAAPSTAGVFGARRRLARRCLLVGPVNQDCSAALNARMMHSGATLPPPTERQTKR